MICVTLGRTRHKMMIAEHQSLAAKGAPLVELRLDWLRNMPDLNRLIKDRPTPVVVTCRRPADGGRWRGAEDQRQMLLRQSIVAGVEYVDLEADTAGQIRRYGKTLRIISHHDFRETPENLEEIHAQLCKLDPDIVKIVTMANSPRDNIPLLKLVAESDVPTIGFCMAISRRAWNTLGPFDAEAFGRGYCEETDWCLRARAAGWSNRLVPDLFVFHKHGGSFADRERKALLEANLATLHRRWPGYYGELARFRRRDPWAVYRAAALLALATDPDRAQNAAILGHDGNHPTRMEIRVGHWRIGLIAETAEEARRLQSV